MNRKTQVTRLREALSLVPNNKATRERKIARREERLAAGAAMDAPAKAPK